MDKKNVKLGINLGGALNAISLSPDQTHAVAVGREGIA
jgi:hypothetical protein